MPYTLKIEHEKCTGCRSCTIACQNHNPQSRGLFRNIQETESSPKTDIPSYINKGCLHCLVPACQKACPTQAIIQDPKTKITFINQTKCMGCGACQKACPVHAPVLIDKRAYKCQLCQNSSTAKIAQIACAAACPLRLIQVIHT